MNTRLRIGSEGRLPDNGGCILLGSLFAVSFFGSLLESRVEGLFSNMNNEGGDEDWISDDDVTKQHALLEGV